MSTAAGRDIRLYGLSKFYGPFKALDDIDLTIAPGEFLTLLGPSGSGKSTLLMALAGFVEPSHGDIFVGGRSITALAPEKRNFGVVFQGYALFPHMSVAENVAYPLKVRGLDRPLIEAKVAEALALVQLDALAKRLPKQLSGGQQQRVALARALVFSPEVLLLDEPMGALDKKLRHDLQIELRQLHRKLGRTFVNVTHDQEEAMAMSDRIAIMRAGRIVQLGAPRDLYDLPETRFVADFLGKSNFIAGRVGETTGGTVLVETADGPIRHAARGRPVKTGDEALLALRPQALRLGPGGDNALPARVETAIFLGTHAELTVRTAGGTPFAINTPIERADALPAEGADVTLSWDRTATVAVAED
ncbi:ABC transporter ATP-binding protein [Zavarzinia compransoris]|uniref:Polyamine ABC transporter ATP-binding protein n=1 Tax=Zavarzinia compransoris TaxID=1264899 RepID=A0A317E576_9PROT|nr:ABC transporter ATP-binding protein [Zavarzinia compransoris]PWR21722.1 polyamine ABC transporter ATP-binding protein [Zavarzinia compransoris]TDP45490.1 putative spermidine/putrescine transport system ATP-binding protein [Zavarzinia compransoris]